jgi:hypothetical protein
VNLSGTTVKTATDVASALATVASYVDTEVAAIKAKTDNLPADPADASDIAAATAAIQSDTDDIQTRLTAIAASVARALGLLHDNAMVDGGAGQAQPTYSADKVLLSARVRVFASSAALAAAALGAADGASGEIYRYTVTGEDTGTGLMKSFKLARGL